MRRACDAMPSVPLTHRATDVARVLSFRARRWSIGILTGPSPFTLAEPEPGLNPVLERRDVLDARAELLADPFMIRSGAAWHMLFEAVVLRGGARRGEIGHAVSADGLRWRYQGIALREPFHLSYPYVFRHGEEHYLLPEAAASGGVRLYRAAPFPSRWELAATLIEGQGLVDSSIFRHGGRWWILGQSASEPRHATLRLFAADALLGPWREHPRSPVVRADRRIARPAGRVICFGGRLLRFAQDCRDGYGMRVHALEILRLDAERYEEVECAGNPFLAGTARPGWNRSGMHHVDAHEVSGGWIACVDGWTNRPWDR